MNGAPCKREIRGRVDDDGRDDESGGGWPRAGRADVAAALWLLRGEQLETVFGALGVTAAALGRGRGTFLAAAEVALTTRPVSGAAPVNGV